MKYSLVKTQDNSNITVLLDGDLFTATDQHPNWTAIVDQVTNDVPDGLRDLFDLTVTLSTKFETLSDRVAVMNGQVYFDGDAVDNALADQIVRFYTSGVDEWMPLVRFWEKLASNPNEHSRTQLYRWLQTHSFTIADDGDIIGYKGVNKDANGNFVSVHAGPAIRNGEQVNGYVVNNPGDVIKMPRSDVQHDPSVACHTGLHVGTWNYAKNFASFVLKVKFNPRDVVSVPTDCNDAKVRTCGYTVVEKIDSPINNIVDPQSYYSYPDVDPDDDDDDDDYDPYYNDYEYEYDPRDDGYSY